MERQRAGGAHWDPEGTTFIVWTTTTSDVAVRLLDGKGNPARTERLHATEPPTRYETRVANVAPGTLYEVLLDGAPVPDPFARSLPQGVHGPAQVVPAGRGKSLAAPPADWVIYELHIGTFTPEGTFQAAIGKLDYLAELGVTAIEIMPVAAFDGHRGWGYDGVALYAPHAPYGTPDDLRKLVEAAHARGLAVVLDVVYNHFGPSGNYLSKYAPQYFTDHIHTPWGAGPDFTWPPMRRLVVENARYWYDEFGFDGLRLDATHQIQDASAKHLLTEIAELARERGRAVFFEDERDEELVLDAHHPTGVWADDLHHYLHILLTGEREGYYFKYEPTLEALADCVRRSSDPAHILCIQNHDQIGNRAQGDRLNSLVPVDAYLAALAVVLFLPGTPLLFMGQEWAASSPFLYFSDHEGDLGHQVSEGRRKEFEHFESFKDPPDPQAKETFERSHLRFHEASEGDHARVLQAHRTLLRLRKEELRGTKVDVKVDGAVLAVRRGDYLLRTRFDGQALPPGPSGKESWAVTCAAIVKVG